MICLQISFCFDPLIAQTAPFRWLYCGESSPSHDIIFNFVGEKWNIDFISVAGCVITKELQDSVNLHNDQIASLMVGKYGNNWRKDFDESLMEEFNNESVVFDLIDSTDFIQDWKVQMETDSILIGYDFEPVSKSTQYKVILKGINLKNGENRVYYRLMADYRTKMVVVEYKD